MENKATHILTFPLDIGAVGYGVYQVAKGASQVSKVREISGDTTKVTNGVYTLEFDTGSNELKTISNSKGASTPLTLQWGWYNSSEGGCTASDGSEPALACV